MVVTCFWFITNKLKKKNTIVFCVNIRFNNKGTLDVMRGLCDFCADVCCTVVPPTKLNVSNIYIKKNPTFLKSINISKIVKNILWIFQLPTVICFWVTLKLQNQFCRKQNK